MSHIIFYLSLISYYYYMVCIGESLLFAPMPLLQGQKFALTWPENLTKIGSSELVECIISHDSLFNYLVQYTLNFLEI